MNENCVRESFDRLDKWIDRNGWEGYDVSDVRSSKLYLFVLNFRERNRFGRYFAHPFFLLERKYTPLLRRLLRTKKKSFPQAIGLLARAYLRAYERYDDIYYRKNDHSGGSQRLQPHIRYRMTRSGQRY